jgi:hypothetical protein
MGAYLTLKLLTGILTLEDFPDLQIGVPDSAIKGPYPAWYLDLPPERFQQGALQAVFRTDTVAITPIFVIVHTDNVPNEEESMGSWLMETLAPSILSQIEAASVAGRFRDETGRGSRVALTDVSYDWRPDLLVAAMRITLEISQYA